MLSSVRARLTLWYAGFLTIVLLAFSLQVYLLVRRALYVRNDSSLNSTLEIASASLMKYPNSSSGSSPLDALQGLHIPDQQIAVLSPNGQLVGKIPNASNLRTCLPPNPSHASDSALNFELPESDSDLLELPETKPDADDSCRGVYRVVKSGGSAENSFVLVVSQSAEPLSDEMDMLQNTLIFSIAFFVLLAASGGWFLARRSLAPMGAMAEAARRVGTENLDERLPINNPRDEMGALATVFNDLLDRLAKSLNQQRQFMADASHNLRSPISTVRTAAQVALDAPHRTETEYREALGIVEKQALRLTQIIEDLFSLARADGGDNVLQKTELYLDELITDAIQDRSTLARSKNVALQAGPMPEAPFSGDERMLRQLILNLLDNAIKFTPAGGRVSVAMEKQLEGYQITVSDTGIGIPVEAQPYVFERFYRVQRSDLQNSDGHGVSGAGLGLAIARWVASAHQGRIELLNSSPSGTVFLVVLPIHSMSKV